MIHYDLRCNEGHEFDGWFRGNVGFEAQQAAKEIACPACGSTEVEKALMAPSIGKSSKSDGPPISPEQWGAGLADLRRQVEQNCDYVGDQFAEEAKKIHYGESAPRDIYGQATEEESRELAEEGVRFGRIPRFEPKN